MSSRSEETDIDLFDGVDEKDLAGADFTAEVIGELRRAFNGLHESSGLTQKAVADRLATSKSAVHRWLYGDGNMTIRKLGELAWAMGCKPTVRIIAEASDGLPEAVATGCADATPVEVHEQEPSADADQLYQLTRISVADAEAARAIGEPLLLTGQTQDALFGCRIVGTGPNTAIARIYGVHVDPQRHMAQPVISTHVGNAALAGKRTKPLRLISPTTSAAIGLREKGECFSVGAMA